MVGPKSKKLAIHWLRAIQRSYPPGTLPGNFLKMLLAVRNHFQKGGIKQVSHFFVRSLGRFLADGRESAYQRWLRENEPTADELAQQRRQADRKGQCRPLVSILLPFQEATASALAATVQSIQDQTCPDWELCLTTNHALSAALRQWAFDLARKDGRVRCLEVPDHAGWAERANAGLRQATGEFISWIEAGDLLAPFALFEMARFLSECPEIDVAYSDEDHFSERGRCRPIIKPDWSPELLWGHNYVGNWTVIRRELAERVGGFRPETDGAHAWDLLLRISEHSQRIRRFPKILHHRRLENGKSGSSRGGEQASRRVITDHLRRRGLPASAKPMANGTYRLTWPVANSPLVSIIIPSRNGAGLIKNCVRGLVESTAYPAREIVIVDNQSTDPEVLSYYDRLEGQGQTRVVPFNKEFNYSAACNEGARHARGQLLLFLNNDIEVIEPGWLEEMVRWALLPGIGVVGAKLLYANKRIQHAGVVLHGNPGESGHIFRSLQEKTPTLFGSPDCYRNYLAVTGACQLMRRDVFHELGGYDETYRLCCGDLVLCLAAWRRGYRIVYTPYARLVHHECSTRGFSDPTESADGRRFARLVNALGLQNDPYFHPALKLVLSQPELQ